MTLDRPMRERTAVRRPRPVAPAPSPAAGRPRPAAVAAGALVVALAAIGAPDRPALAGDEAIPAVAFFDEPSLDRWFYPFNTTPGSRAVMPIFGATGTPDFDDRDGTAFLRWDTSAEIEPGLGPDAYDVISVRITLTNQTADEVPYDDSVDPYTAYLPPDDPEFTEDDPGSPLELFGAAARNGFDPLSFPENGPYSPGDPVGPDVRNIYAIDLEPNGDEIDVNNNVRDRFTAVPWAVGTVDGLAPGDLVPGDAVFTFELDLSRPEVEAYVAAQLDQGALAAVVTSLQRVEVQGGTFVRGYAKESVQAQVGLVDAATLEIVWEVAGGLCPEDVDGSGAVDFPDVLAILSAFGDCDGCPEDVDGSGAVDFPDLLAVLAAFGPCPQ